MPNWVYNKVEISGSKTDLLEFANKAKQQHETNYLSDTWIKNADGNNVKNEDRKNEKNISEPCDLSFWNFVSPKQELLDTNEYWGREDFPEGCWYQWNIDNWGVKWDTSGSSLETILDKLGETDTIIYRYDTAWGIPYPAMEAMVEQHPNLEFQFYCEEEQGWGAEFLGVEGELNETRSWEIPSCHADYVANGSEDSCICANDDDEESWYSDCPKPVQPYKVVIRTDYSVMASDPAKAYESITENLEVSDNTFIEVFDETGNKVYPVL